MDDINFEDLMDDIIASAVDLPFIEFYKTAFAGYKNAFNNERNLAWMIWMMSRKINGNEIKARKLLNEATKTRIEKKEKESAESMHDFNKRFSARLKSMQDNGEVLNGKVRRKYKRIIEMLCIGSIYDFETAMRTEFPNFVKVRVNEARKRA